MSTRLSPGREGSPHTHTSDDSDTLSDPLLHITHDTGDLTDADLHDAVDGDDPTQSQPHSPVAHVSDEGITTPSKPLICYCLTRRQAKFACLCCTVFGLTMFIMFCVTWWVIIPFVAQQQVDASTLSLGRMSLSNPNGEEFDISVEGALHSSIPFDANIDPTQMNVYYSYPDPSVNTTHLALSDTPIPYIESMIGSVMFPPMVLTAGSDVVPIQTNTTFKIADQVGFQKFMLALVHTNSCTWRLRGDVTVHIHLTSVITKTIDGVHLDKEAVVQGMRGLMDANLTVINVDVVGGDPDSVWIRPTLSIMDNTDISMDMSPDGVTLSMLYNLEGVGPIAIGNASVPDFHLSPGLTYMSTIARIYKQPAYPHLLPTLLSGYILGHDLDLTVTGAPNGIPKFPIMSDVLTSLKLPATLPGITKQIVQKGYVVGLEIVDWEAYMEVTLIVSNLWNVTLEMLACNATLLHQDVAVGTAIIPQFKPRVIIGPYQTVSTPIVGVKILWNLELIELLGDFADDLLVYLSMTGTMDLALLPPTNSSLFNISNAFVTSVQYEQDNVPATLFPPWEPLPPKIEKDTINDKKPVIQYGSIHTGASSVSLSFIVSNSWNATMELTACHLTISYQDEKLGTIDITSFKTRVIVPAFTQVSTPLLPVDIQSDDTIIMQLLSDLSSGDVVVGLSGTMSFSASPVTVAAAVARDDVPIIPLTIPLDGVNVAISMATPA